MLDGGKAAISRLTRSEFLADSTVLIFPVLVYENGPSNKDISVSTNVALDHSLTDGDVDTTYPPQTVRP